MPLGSFDTTIPEVQRASNVGLTNTELMKNLLESDENMPDLAEFVARVPLPEFQSMTTLAPETLTDETETVVEEMEEEQDPYDSISESPLLSSLLGSGGPLANSLQNNPELFRQSFQESPDIMFEMMKNNPTLAQNLLQNNPALILDLMQENTAEWMEFFEANPMIITNAFQNDPERLLDFVELAVQGDDEEEDEVDTASTEYTSDDLMALYGDEDIVEAIMMSDFADESGEFITNEALLEWHSTEEGMMVPIPTGLLDPTVDNGEEVEEPEPNTDMMTQYTPEDLMVMYGDEAIVQAIGESGLIDESGEFITAEALMEWHETAEGMEVEIPAELMAMMEPAEEVVDPMMTQYTPADLMAMYGDESIVFDIGNSGLSDPSGDFITAQALMEWHETAEGMEVEIPAELMAMMEPAEEVADPMMTQYTPADLMAMYGDASVVFDIANSRLSDPSGDFITAQALMEWHETAEGMEVEMPAELMAMNPPEVDNDDEAILTAQVQFTPAELMEIYGDEAIVISIGSSGMADPSGEFITAEALLEWHQTEMGRLLELPEQLLQILSESMIESEML